jgi:signal transduction histidine kinase
MIADTLNTRILVIDDEESVRDSFVAVLSPRAGTSVLLDASAAAFFGAPEPAPPTSSALRFEVDCAANGRKGLALVETAVADGRPYAMIFCDMRMPGWDGKETVEHIRRIDPRAEIAFVTAYSDHTLQSLVEGVGANIGYYVKPFATDELRQLATKSVLDWSRARELENLIRTITSIRGDAGDIDRLLRHLLQQVCAWLDTDSAALARIGDGVQFRAGVGELADPARALPLLERVSDPGLCHERGALVMPIWEFGVAIALLRGSKITPERLYLLRVFLEHAGVAIKNSEMAAQLADAERMGAVGQALGFVVHDLLGPVGTVRQLLEMVREGDETLMSRDELLLACDRLLGNAFALVDDTLAFSRGGRNVVPAPTQLGQVLTDTLLSARHSLGAQGVVLIVDIPVELIARVDALGVIRIVQNLVSNAGAALADRPGARVSIAALAVQHGVEIRIDDNGPGLPADLVGRLFQPFATKGKTTGTGFGLAIVKQIVVAHGGRISVETGPAGTSFTVFIPDAGGMA